MPVQRSIIENMTLDTNTEVYVQASPAGTILLSFDGKESSFNIHLTSSEAGHFAELISQVLEQVEGEA